MAVLLAGGAGFIGTKLAQHFLNCNKQIIILDNLCRGSYKNIESLTKKENIHFFEIDITNFDVLSRIVSEFHSKYSIETVWHMAANSDIPAGIANAHVDLHDTFMTTFNLLQVMKIEGIRRIAFASSSAVYGNLGFSTPLHENMGPLLPISNYGAMKLASEALISAAAESWLETAWIFRFPNVVGAPATHGVILDFIRKLKKNPNVLQVLGDGTQQKAYLHVKDLIEAMIFITGHAHQKINLFNIGPEDSGCSVRSIAEHTTARVSPSAQIVYGTEPRGWVGDVPQFSYSIEKLRQLGWSTPHTSLEAVMLAINEIAQQEGC